MDVCRKYVQASLDNLGLIGCSDKTARHMSVTCMTNRISWDLSEPCFKKRLDHCNKRSCQPLVELLAGEVPAWPLPGAGCGTLSVGSGSVASAGVCLDWANSGPAGAHKRQFAPKMVNR